MISNINRRISIFFLHTALFFFLFGLASGTPSANADGEPPIRGEIMPLSNNALSVLVTEKTDSDYRPGERVIVRISRNTRIFNHQLQFISMGNLSPGDAVTVSPVTSIRAEVTADMIHLRRKK